MPLAVLEKMVLLKHHYKWTQVYYDESKIGRFCWTSVAALGDVELLIISAVLYTGTGMIIPLQKPPPQICLDYMTLNGLVLFNT
jgi:hypothetical protein